MYEPSHREIWNCLSVSSRYGCGRKTAFPAHLHTNAHRRAEKEIPSKLCFCTPIRIQRSGDVLVFHLAAHNRMT